MMTVPLLLVRFTVARLLPTVRWIFLLALASPLATGHAGTYSQVVIFGDSLSDVGNFAHVTEDTYGIAYPSSEFNYSDHRFTDSNATYPGSGTYVGLWHEQLARRFLGMAPATNSLDGGTDYAYGDAQTLDGTSAVVEGPVHITVENMGQQVYDYLASVNGTADPDALYVVWGGANDLFADSTDANVSATAHRVTVLVERLAAAGARKFIVPNLPPLGDTPRYNTNATLSSNLNQACSDYRNDLNTDLDSAVTALAALGINVTITRPDVFTLFQNILTNYGSFGFTDVRNAARGEQIDVDASLFWDDVHPTTAGHNQIAQLAADILPGGHPAFFAGEAILDSGDFAYLAFPDGEKFGYYTYQFYPYLYQTDLGFEYVVPAAGAGNDVYLYDFKLQAFFYTSPTLFPYLYDFKESGFYYYFTGTTAPRVFYDFVTKKYIYSN